MNTSVILDWVKALAEAHGRGGGSYISSVTDLHPSTVSKLLSGKVKLDEKTVKIICLLLATRGRPVAGDNVIWSCKVAGYEFFKVIRNNTSQVLWGIAES
jgi:hypothetical protein